MARIPPRFDPRAIEASTRAFWESRGLAGGEGPVGTPGGPLVHQLLGTFFPSDRPVQILQRFVAADAEARQFALAGKRTLATVQFVRPDEAPAPPDVLALVKSLGVRCGASGMLPTESGQAAEQAAASRLAQAGWLTSRTRPVPTCPHCRTPRTPQTTIYEEELGPVYLVAMRLHGPADPPLRALVWVDAAWKLLGTIALLLHPDRPYAHVRIRRHGRDESLLVDRSAVPRLARWLPGSSFETVEERPGRDWAGTAYDHPLALEYPAVAGLPAPAGTLIASPEVLDSGTGIVPLVPSHGGRDAEVASGLGLSDGPIVAIDGRLDATLSHTYAGLPLDSAEAFVLRDLAENGNLLAQPSLRRGVPFCALCGTAVVWSPARIWAFEPRHLVEGVGEDVARLLKGTPRLQAVTAVPWPVSETTESPAGSGVELRECDRCDRLDVPGEPERCACGGTTRRVRRQLLPAFREAVRSWARQGPIRPGEEVRLYLPDRRRVPSLIHTLVARGAESGGRGDLKVEVLPSLSAVLPDGAEFGHLALDAYRSALLTTDTSPRFAPTFSDRWRREDRRLRTVWAIAAELDALSRSSGFLPGSGPIAARVAELLPEDRALLSRFEGLRTEVLRLFEAGELADAARALSAFLEGDLRSGYLRFARARLHLPDLPPERAAALRTLWHVLPLWTELYAPFAPFTMEAIHRGLRGGTESLFERRFSPVQESLRDPALETAHRRWLGLARPLQRARVDLGLAGTSPWPHVVIIAGTEDLAGSLRAELDVLRRLLRATEVTIASPNSSWKGRKVRARPVLEEIQRLYPAEASRVVRLLERLPVHRIVDGLKTSTLSVSLEARAVQILPGMVELYETIPDRFAAVPWEGGELFVELPADTPAGRPTAPPLSFDAFAPVELLRRRLRVLGAASPEKVRVFAAPPLGEELQRASDGIAHYLGVAVEVALEPEGFASSETIHGRTRRGVSWAIQIPGHRPRVRPTRGRRTASHVPRAPRPTVPEGWSGPGTDYLAEELREREATIRNSLERFDQKLGVPIMGPTKLSLAWEAGLHGFEAIAQAPWDRLEPIPGFGEHVAARVVEAFGGTVPPRAIRSRARAPAEALAPPAEVPPSPHPLAATEANEVAGRSSFSPLASDPTGPFEPPGRPVPPSEASAGLAATPPPTSTTPDPPDSVRPPSPSDGEASSGRASSEGSADPLPDPSREGTHSPPPAESTAPSSPAREDLPSPGMGTTPHGAAGPSVPEYRSSLRTAGLALGAEGTSDGNEGSSGVVPQEDVVRSELKSDPGTDAGRPSVSAMSPGDPAAPEAAIGTTSLPASEALHSGSLAGPGGGADEAALAEPDTAAPSLVGGGPDLAGDEQVSPLEPARAPDAGPPALQPGGPEVPPVPEPDGTAHGPDSPENGIVLPVPDPVGPPTSDVGSPPLPVAPAVPAAAPLAPVPSTPPPSGVELWEEGGGPEPWEKFLDSTGAGLHGLCLSREFPDRLRAYLGVRDVELVWLSNSGRERSVRPSDLDAVESAIRRGLSDGRVSIVYLGGVEYLLSIHPPEAVVAFLERVDKVARERLVRVLLPVTTALLSEERLARLRAALARPSG